MAHDFNNLLAGITGSLELLEIRLGQGRVADLERYITAAKGAAQRAAALTHRLLAFSRQQTLSVDTIDINRVVTGMEELVRRTVGPEITVEVIAADDLWHALIDPNQLENALLNLCINARDAMPDGGKLTVQTCNRLFDRRTAEVQGMQSGEYVSLSVSDNGVGMPPDIVDHAFDPFFTTKPTGSGTGLGLSMIYGFVRQSGGHASIFSEPGRGTTVFLYLPRKIGIENLINAPAELAEARHAEKGATVLVVDDEPTVRMLVTELLEEMGYLVIEARDAAAGMRILMSTTARIDLLITDVGLPGGMNGRQLADAARKLRQNLKVLFITGYAANAALNQDDLDPGMHTMTKPFSLDALANKVGSLIAVTR